MKNVDERGRRNHKKVEQNKAEKEEEDLLSFVDNLNAETYTDDLELQVLIERVKCRINALQKEKNACETRLQTALDVSFEYGIYCSISLKLVLFVNAFIRHFRV